MKKITHHPFLYTILMALLLCSSRAHAMFGKFCKLWGFTTQNTQPTHGVYVNSPEGQQLLTNFYVSQSWVQQQYQANNNNNSSNLRVTVIKKEPVRPR